MPESPPPAHRTPIHVGLAGWDYADWAGTVYPARGSRGFDRLAWISRWVDLIEINSTFYRPVAPRVAEGWAKRVEHRSDFLFTAKSHRSWTHDLDSDPRTVVSETLEGLAPLRDAGRFGCLLVQFPQSFHHSPQALSRLGALLDRVGDWPVAVEVRHASWNEPRVEEWLRDRGVGWCLVDQPQVGASTLGPLGWVTSSTGYARLHGRNVADWFRPDAGRDARYDYRYTLDQLQALTGQVREMAERAREVFVVQNNHFRGQALANALQFRHLLDGERPAAPEDLVATYPDLRASVTVRRSRLF